MPRRSARVEARGGVLEHEADRRRRRERARRGGASGRVPEDVDAAARRRGQPGHGSTDVVLPDPDSPTRPSTSPGAMVKATPSTARNPGRPAARGTRRVGRGRVLDHPSARGLVPPPRRRRRGRDAGTTGPGASRPTRSAPRPAALGCTGAPGRRTARDAACSTTCPAYITATRSARSATTPMLWVISTIAVPSGRAPRSSSRISACTVTSRAVVGSSAMISSGRRTIAIAIITRCFCRRRSGAGRAYAPLRIRDADQVEQLDRARCASSPGHRRCARSASMICQPTVNTGSSAVDGLLEHHRDRVPRTRAASPRRSRRPARVGPSARSRRHGRVSGSRPRIACASSRTCRSRTRRRWPGPRPGRPRRLRRDRVDGARIGGEGHSAGRAVDDGVLAVIRARPGRCRASRPSARLSRSAGGGRPGGARTQRGLSMSLRLSPTSVMPSTISTIASAGEDRRSTRCPSVTSASALFRS